MFRHIVLATASDQGIKRDEQTMRKLWLVLVSLCFVPCVVHAAGQEAADPPQDVLVQCGDEQVSTFGDTVSKDGHYAVGWTIRAKGGKKAPAPWAEVDQNSPATASTVRLLENEDGTPRKSAYTVVDGLVDLRAKRFVPWQSQEPHYVYQARGSMSAAWCGDGSSTRYGILCNNHKGNSYEATVDLQLVVLGPDGAHFTDLKPGADTAIKAYLRKRDPKDAARYAWICEPDKPSDGDKGQRALTLFKGDTLTLPFTAAIGLETQNVDAGQVSFALPQGTVTGTVSDPEARKALLQ